MKLSKTGRVWARQNLFPLPGRTQFEIIHKGEQIAKSRGGRQITGADLVAAVDHFAKEDSA